MKLAIHKRTVLGSAVAMALLGMSAQASAATNAELEARIAQLEAALQSLLDEKQDTQAATPSAPQAPASPAPVAAEEPPRESHNYSFRGYVKLDAAFSQYSSGDLAPSSAGTQFYIPSTIPVGDDSAGEGIDLNTQARESRLIFTSDHALASGDKLTSYIELDFFLSGDGNERVSNSYNPRMRHAYFKYNNWLFGQTWSTFQDVGALPENLDFVGPSESTAFQRQPMIRYTNGAFEFALENPETTLTPFGGGARILTDDGGMPDFAARYTHTLDNGYVKVAGLVRNLNYDIDGVDDSEIAYGISVSGKHFIGDNDIRWMATTGAGLGRYLGLNTSNGGVLDANGNIEAIDQFGVFGSYRHLWDSKWRSNFTLGYLSIDNDIALTGTGVTKSVYSVHANLLYSPIPKLTVGGELTYAEREIESGADGDLTRLLFSAKYAF
ncbi:MAG: DcaP family trimeric outer membrane transporter [Pseudomonadota bacterium]